MSRVLIIGDQHEPVSHPNYLRFCCDIHKKWDCDSVVFIGDIADWHSISFHLKQPECPSAYDEYEATKAKIKVWHATFPHAKVCIGNHDERVLRLAASVGIPEALVRNYKRTWNTPTWTWDFDFVIDDVYYLHGTGFAGIHPAWNCAGKMLMSVVLGHIHSAGGVQWRVNPQRRIFSMDVGCGIDVRAWQFVYGKHIKKRPVLAAAVVIDGIPYHEIMPIGENENYRKEKKDDIERAS